jgi:hypothetical protein
VITGSGAESRNFGGWILTSAGVDVKKKWKKKIKLAQTQVGCEGVTSRDTREQ